jgi:hypothetical protein
VGTAGTPSEIKLEVFQDQIIADRKSLALVTFSVTDKNYIKK